MSPTKAIDNLTLGTCPILNSCRHIYKLFPLTYDPLYWGAVFPLGMYAVGTFHMARALDFDFHDTLLTAFSWVALAAWTLTFAAYLVTLFGAQNPVQ